MRFYISCIVIFFVPLYAISQVGIGTTTPNAQLEIKSTNQATPANTDGILIPKVDEFPVTPPTASQDGMMVYVTGSGTPGKGYYYWDNGTTSWLVFSSSVGKINDLSDGKSDNDGTDDGSSIFLGINAGANDDSTANRNVGVGFNALEANTSGFRNTSIGYQTLFSNTTGYRNTANGYASLFSNTTGYLNTATGVAALFFNTMGELNTANGNYSLYFNTTGKNNTANGYGALTYNLTGSNNTAYGLRSGYKSLGDRNIFLGYQSGYNETGNDKLYIESSNADANNALIYGEFDTNILRVNGELQLGNTAATRYAMPTADGTINQVMQTDGAGNLNWINASTDDQNISGSSLSGTTLTIGIEGGVSETVDLSSLQGGGAQAINELSDAKYNSTSNSLYIGTGTGNSDVGNGDRNLGIGYQSLFNNSTGDSNTSIGYQTMHNASGFGNTAMGQQALSEGNTGDGNTAIGLWASRANSSGASNLTMGAQSFYANTTGSGNTILGTLSGRYVNGDYNTLIGFQSGKGNGTVSNFSRSVFIGYNSGYYETNSDRLYIENSSTSSPLIYGEFDNNLIRINGDFEVNNSGRIEIIANIDASGVTGTGSLEIANSLRIDGNEIITNTNSTLHLQANNGGDLRVDDTTLVVDASANRVGFQTLTPSTDLHLKQSDNLQGGGGGITFESALANINWKIYHSGSALSFAENGVRRAYISAATGAYVTTSDRTLKKNITRVEDDVLSKLSEIQVYRYHYLDQNPSNEKTLGVMAQEIQLQFPELVTTGEDGKLGMNYGGLSVVAIKAIKEQQIEIENQRKEIEELKKLVQQLIDKK